ncbi:hypothetical protein DICVIV_08271 [Dictyocaulus viviparus]|uniref:Uncharacterized protein n=1 Tax=Dictyocaulus viviparus TaxID=29172 RepID=A0A0D8XM49_DICVI|nr:hypothetical protein DICVIV_08271 [Dictyocaulus viviparus]
MWFPYVLLTVLVSRSFYISAQSVDEEESAHLVEGSGGFDDDDEDIEITTSITSLPSDTTKSILDNSGVYRGTFSSSASVIILGLLTFLIIGIIFIIICFICCRYRSKTYRPGEHRRSENLLSSPQSR